MSLDGIDGRWSEIISAELDCVSMASQVMRLFKFFGTEINDILNSKRDSLIVQKETVCVKEPGTAQNVEMLIQAYDYKKVNN